jgi:hypothetical protein
LFNGAASSRRTEDCRINRQQASSERQLTAIKRSGDEVHQALASRSRWKNFMHVLSWITKGFDSSVPVVSIARLDSSRWAFLFAVCWFQPIRFAKPVTPFIRPDLFKVEPQAVRLFLSKTITDRGSYHGNGPGKSARLAA